MTEIVQKDDDTDVLRETADPINDDEFRSDELQRIITNMKEALHDTEDGVAIAAPQIGVSKRVFLVRDKVFNDRSDIEGGDKVFINPDIVNTSQETVEMEEGCLSVRNVYGKVTRHKQATVRAYNFNGDEFELGGSGLLAQIFQHETEHLQGTLFVDKASNLHKIDPEKRRSLEEQKESAEE